MLQGHEVTVVDNFFTGRKRNIEHWMGHENFEVLNHDIVNPLYLEGENSYCENSISHELRVKVHLGSELPVICNIYIYIYLKKNVIYWFLPISSLIYDFLT